MLNIFAQRDKIHANKNLQLTLSCGNSITPVLCLLESSIHPGQQGNHRNPMGARLHQPSRIQIASVNFYSPSEGFACNILLWNGSRGLKESETKIKISNGRTLFFISNFSQKKGWFKKYEKCENMYLYDYFGTLNIIFSLCFFFLVFYYVSGTQNSFQNFQVGNTFFYKQLSPTLGGGVKKYEIC